MKNFELIELSLEEQLQFNGGLSFPMTTYFYLSIDLYNGFVAGFSSGYQAITNPQ